MACGYGYKRGADFYYQHGGFPHSYAYDWKGLAPMASGSRAALGDHSDLDVGVPVSMSMQANQRSVLTSGPEQTRLAYGLGGLFDLSESEKDFVKLAAVAALGYLAWVNRKKIKKAFK